MSKIQKGLKDQSKAGGPQFRDYWQKQNYFFLIISLVFLILGYFFMMDGTWDSTLSMSVSPIVLLIAYLILIPLAVFFKIPTKIKEKLDVSSKD